MVAVFALDQCVPWLKVSIIERSSLSIACPKNPVLPLCAIFLCHQMHRYAYQCHEGIFFALEKNHRRRVNCCQPYSGFAARVSVEFLPLDPSARPKSIYSLSHRSVVRSMTTLAVPSSAVIALLWEDDLPELLVTTRIAVGRLTVGRRASCIIGSSETLVSTPWVSAAELRAARPSVVGTALATLVHAVDETGKLLLHDCDTLLDNRIRLQVACTLDLEVELVRDCLVVKLLRLLSRLLEVGVLAPGPGIIKSASFHITSSSECSEHTTPLPPSRPPACSRTTCRCATGCCAGRTRSPPPRSAPTWHAPSRYPS